MLRVGPININKEPMTSGCRSKGLCPSANSRSQVAKASTVGAKGARLNHRLLAAAVKRLWEAASWQEVEQDRQTHGRAFRLPLYQFLKELVFSLSKKIQWGNSLQRKLEQFMVLKQVKKKL